jgi:hypothetical protein
MIEVSVEGQRVTYPSLDGAGMAVEPHQERPTITWAELSDRFGSSAVLQLQDAAAAAELRHLQTCTLAQHVPDVRSLET